MTGGGARLALATVEEVIAGALALNDASLVIHRRGILVEFKTELLSPGLVTTNDHGHQGWQVGSFEGHHCHLHLPAVSEVLFHAEPVSCQGGRLNYTVWFLTAVDCGNPYRPDGLFSVTLNAPYNEDGSPRKDLIDAVQGLHRRFQSCEGVLANDAFLAPAAFGKTGTSAREIGC